MISPGRYILAQIIPATLFAVTISLLILLLERALRLLSLVLEANRSAQLLINMITSLMPHYLGFALPCALFIGILVSFERLSGHREIAAFFALGFGFGRILRPILGLTLIIMLIIAGLFSYAQPYARYFFYTLQETARATASHGASSDRLFAHVGEWTIVIDSIDTAGNKMNGLLAYQQQKDGRRITITAASATIEPPEKEGHPTVLLQGGKRLEIAAPGQPESEMHIDVVHFGTMNFLLSFLPYRDIRQRGEKSPREWTIPELFRERENPPPQFTRAILDGELHGRLARIVSILLLPFLAISYGAADAARRGHGSRVYRFAFGMLTLFMIHLVLKYGEFTVEKGVLSPFAGLWAPLIVFFIATGIFYIRVLGAIGGRGRIIPRFPVPR